MGPKGYENPHLLWSPEELSARLADPSVLAIDTRPAADYARGHVPGAAHFDLYGVSLNDTRPEPLAAFLWMVAYLMESRGVDYDKRVVFYDEISGMRSARGFWFLELFGHEDVHVLDGGMVAWREAGLPVSQEPRDPVRTDFSNHRRPLRAERLATFQEVLGAVGKAGACILDTRREGEYRGTEVRAARGGAVPGAVHIEWTRALDEKGAFLPARELRSLFEGEGVTPDREIIPYCHGGYRSAHSYLALRLLGHPRVRNYLGSWKEWGDREDLPIEVPR